MRLRAEEASGHVQWTVLNVGECIVLQHFVVHDEHRGRIVGRHSLHKLFVHQVQVWLGSVKRNQWLLKDFEAKTSYLRMFSPMAKNNG